MKKPLALAFMAMTLAASPALAQSQTDSPHVATVGLGAQQQWYSPRGNEMRASKLIGTTVRNDANESIGSINDVILAKDGKVSAVVIGVGGFLGMGEREVAVNFDALRIAQDANHRTTVSLDATKDSLKAAPEWQWAGDRTGTSGNGSAPTRQPVAK